MPAWKSPLAKYSIISDLSDALRGRKFSSGSSPEMGDMPLTPLTELCLLFDLYTSNGCHSYIKIRLKVTGYYDADSSLRSTDMMMKRADFRLSNVLTFQM
jgi:hypothetical protein